MPTAMVSTTASVAEYLAAVDAEAKAAQAEAEAAAAEDNDWDDDDDARTANHQPLDSCDDPLNQR